MGKEIRNKNRGLEYFASFPTIANKHYIQWMISQKWFNPNEFVTIDDIIEDGEAHILIKNQFEERRFSCKGLKCHGNL